MHSFTGIHSSPILCQVACVALGKHHILPLSSWFMKSGEMVNPNQFEISNMKISSPLL